jgi:hypothetical protein
MEARVRCNEFEENGPDDGLRKAGDPPKIDPRHQK